MLCGLGFMLCLCVGQVEKRALEFFSVCVSLSLSLSRIQIVLG